MATGVYPACPMTLRHCAAGMSLALIATRWVAKSICTLAPGFSAFTAWMMVLTVLKKPAAQNFSEQHG